ncbi:MAG: hypothetical protein JNK48_25690 [Bryobacterales bacterium]|nr:hypothetical protein [Bryobacterales bacterium]
MTKHYSESDFLDRLYEVGREDGHLEVCAECRAKYSTWLAARRQLTREPDVSAGVLAEQRQRIFARTARPVRSMRSFWRWSPALAMVALVMFAVLWDRHSPQPVVVVETAQVSDTQVLADIYRTAYDVEPQAVAPLHGLFEDKGQAND